MLFVCSMNVVCFTDSRSGFGLKAEDNQDSINAVLQSNLYISIALGLGGVMLLKRLCIYRAC